MYRDCISYDMLSNKMLLFRLSCSVLPLQRLPLLNQTLAFISCTFLSDIVPSVQLSKPQSNLAERKIKPTFYSRLEEKENHKKERIDGQKDRKKAFHTQQHSNKLQFQPTADMSNLF